jgi:hypothetical protein
MFTFVSQWCGTHQWRVDPLAKSHLAYLDQQLTPLVGFKLDHATIVRRALLALVEQVDAMRTIEDPEMAQMRRLLEGVRLREAASPKDTVVQPNDLDKQPELTFKQHQKEGLDRLKGTH